MLSVMGLDPGMKGGLAIVGDRLHAVAMPPTLADVWAEIVFWSKDVTKAYIESVHSMPGQGVSSSFKFGRGYGNLEAFLTAAGIPFEYVSPGVWQRSLGCLSKGAKNVTKARAQQLFPKLKITHATADALLIAEYGWRKSTAHMQGSTTP